MTITHRRILYLTFFGVFFVVAPLLLLYGAGFRFDVATGKVFRTGLIVVDSTPRPQRVLLNGERVEVSSDPVRISNVLPGAYLVRLERDGYHAWERSMTVRSGFSTTMDGVRLFADAVPTLVREPVDLMVQAPNKRRLALVPTGGHSLLLLDEETSATSVLLSAAPDVIVSIVWSPDNERLALIFTDGSIGIIDVALPEELIHLAAPDGELIRLVWDSPTAVLLLTDTTLSVLDAASGAQHLVHEDVLDVQVLDGTRYLLLADVQNVVLATQRADEPVSPLGTLELTASARFLPSPARKLTVLDAASDTLTIMDATAQPLRTDTLRNVTRALWTDDARLLAFGNDFELSVFDPAEQTSVLVNRTSNPFLDWWWLGETGYLFVAQRDGLQAVETFTDNPVQFTGLVADRVTSLAMSRNDETMFYLTDEALVALSLLTP